MKIEDFIYHRKLSNQQFADMCGINIQTLYNIFRGKNTRYFDICKILAVTGDAVDIWEILPPKVRNELEQKKKELLEKENFGKSQLPTNEELMERARKAHWGSKFSGMCC